MILVKIAYLPMLVKVLQKTGRPFFCAFMWALLILVNGFMFDLAFGSTVLTVSVDCIVELLAAMAFFWLLNAFDGDDVKYWTILVVAGLALLCMPEINLDPPAPPMAMPSGMPTSLPDALHRAVQQQQQSDTIP